MPYVPEPQKQIQLNRWVPYWTKILLSAGIPANKLDLVLSQIIHESNYFTSNAYLIDKNPSGITWNIKYNKRPGASVGRKRPAGEGGNYVKFDTYENAAKDYARILNINTGFGRPIDSTNFVQYADLLKKNKFYTAKQADYTAGMKAAITRLKKWINLDKLLPNVAAKKKIRRSSSGSWFVRFFQFLRD